MKKLTTGVPGLDVLTHGGLPLGRATLVCGRSGTCKSLLSLQVAANAARAGQRALFISVEESPEDLVEVGDALGLGLTQLVREGSLRLSDLTPSDEATLVSGEYDVAGLVHRIEAAHRQFGFQLLVLDSASALFSPRPSSEQLRLHFLQLLTATRRLGVTTIITAEAPTADHGPLTTLGIEDFLCDLVLVLRNLVDGERRRRTVEVHKYRRSSHYRGEYPATMTARGLTVFPLDAREPPVGATLERFSSGIQGLDALNQGGWLRDSIVLLRGPSGSGKTVLAGTYARAGALRGERVMYYGFEEPRPILLRNFAALGLPMEELERAGHLRLECRYPEATSPEDLLVELRRSLMEYNPSLIVIDSISSIEHSTSERGFRQFMVGVAALLREHHRSVLLTQTTNTFTEEATPAFLSTIPDAILLMDYSFARQRLQRTARLLKMRGSAHSTEEHRVSIGPGGISMEPLVAQGLEAATHLARELLEVLGLGTRRG